MQAHRTRERGGEGGREGGRDGGREGEREGGGKEGEGGRKTFWWSSTASGDSTTALAGTVATLGER